MRSLLPTYVFKIYWMLDSLESRVQPRGDVQRATGSGGVNVPVRAH
jgi:hypothetical protein